MEPIDTTNRQLVGANGDQIIVLMPSRSMTHEEALVHAAFIVSIVGDDDLWERTLKAVQNT